MMAETQDTQQGRDQLDLRNLIERLPALVLCALPDGSVEFANRTYHEYTGWSVEELSGREWQTLIHPEDRREFDDHWSAALASGKAFETICSHLVENGLIQPSRKWIVLWPRIPTIPHKSPYPPHRSRHRDPLCAGTGFRIIKMHVPMCQSMVDRRKNKKPLLGQCVTPSF